MNTIILKGTRHEMRMGPSTTISEKMIFVRWAAQPSCPAQLHSVSTRRNAIDVCQGGEHGRRKEAPLGGTNDAVAEGVVRSWPLLKIEERVEFFGLQD